MKVFEQWQEMRKARGNAVPHILQKPYDCTALSHWLALFVTEVRKADGRKYPPNSVYQILCGILHFMRKQDPFVPKFLDRSTNALEKNNIGQFQTCFPRLWSGLTHLTWSLLVMQVTPIHFTYHKCTLLFCIPVQVFHHNL